MLIRLVLMCTACAHNLPEDATPNRLLSPNPARAYVDMNGTFYPPDWPGPDGTVRARAAGARRADPGGDAGAGDWGAGLPCPGQGR